ncbi:flavin reductase family protein [Oryzomonas japonica]|uniref:Flavin reductase family protein n=1 Tax=Oryzomonas japonica TaxID=2603858 RepID=A0A7J4ZNQ7_9BACT|nr:flavin reductase family protein [Oryzomonas japonica]KAB0663974.1 flavin reductase family protein [Oryzomonas japonica]
MKQSLGAKTLLFPTPVLMVGTYDKAGKPNIMTAAWGGVCCSEPPCIAVSLRKSRHSYDSIVERKAFTVGIANGAYMAEADYAGMASGRSADKFGVTGLTVVRSDVVDAPYAEEYPLVLECRLVHTFDLGIHTQFVGEIIDVKADRDTLSEDGLPDILKLQPLIYDTAHKGYHAVGPLLGKAYSVGKKFM